MDWKSFDRVRRNVGPVHLDLVESYARGKISRRNFIRRGTIIGLSMPFIGAVISACGDDDDDSATTGTGATTGTTPGSAGAGQQGGIIRIAYQTPAATLDPIAMQDLGAYGLTAQSFEFLVTLGEDGELAPGLAESWEPNEDGTRVDVQPAPGRQVAGRRRLHVGRRGRHDGPPGRRRQRRPRRRHRRGRRRHHRPQRRRVQPRGRQRQLPVPRLGVQRPDADHPGQLRDRHDARRDAERHRAVEARQLRPRHRCVVRAQPRLVGRPDTARRPGDAVLRRRRHDGDGDAGWRRRRPRAVLRARRRGAAEQPRLHRARGASRRRTARSGCAATRASSSTRRCARRSPTRSTASRWSAPCSRAGRRSPTTTSSPRSCRSSTRRSRRSGSRTSRWPSQLLADAGVEGGLQAVLHAAELQEIPELAQLIQAGAAEAGINLELAIESLDTFYGAQWCPAEPADPPCSGAAELGIVDYGHRPTPDVFLNAALKTNGVWNSSQYSNAGARRRVHGVPGGGRRRGPDGGCRHAADAPQRRGPDRAAVLLQLPLRPLQQLPGRPGVGARADVHGEGVAGLNGRGRGRR